MATTDEVIFYGFDTGRRDIREEFRKKLLYEEALRTLKDGYVRAVDDVKAKRTSPDRRLLLLEV